MMLTHGLTPHQGNGDTADGSLHPITATTVERGTGGRIGTSS